MDTEPKQITEACRAVIRAKREIGWCPVYADVISKGEFVGHICSSDHNHTCWEYCDKANPRKYQPCTFDDLTEENFYRVIPMRIHDYTLTNWRTHVERMATMERLQDKPAKEPVIMNIHSVDIVKKLDGRFGLVEHRPLFRQTRESTKTFPTFSAAAISFEQLEVVWTQWVEWAPGVSERWPEVSPTKQPISEPETLSIHETLSILKNENRE